MRIWLIAAGLLAVLVINGVMALAVTRAVSASLVTREGEVAQEFLTSILAAEGSAGGLFAQPGPTPALTSFAAHVRSLPGIVRANIYAPDGFIRYSTEANLIGLQFRDNAELNQSFGGRIIAKLEEISDSGKDEHLALGRRAGEKLIEAYIPVAGEGGRVIAVVEFYRTADMVTATVGQITRAIWLAAGLSGAILFLAFAGVTALSRRLGRR